MSDKIYVTQEGLDNLISELKNLVEVVRPEVGARISTAKELGDASENIEYHLAKEEQIATEVRISELEDIVKRAVVVQNNKDSVNVGSKVTVHVEGEEDTFHIVGEPEADPLINKISHKSPLGEVLVGKKVGETFVFDIPAGGKITYKIVNIK